MPELNGFPGNPEVWRNDATGAFYLVYQVPDTDPPVPLAWEIDEENLQAGFGTGQTITIDRSFANDTAMNATGWLQGGDHKQIVNTGEDPYVAWENTVTKQAAVRPWLQDDEVLSLLMEGLIENREISDAELQQTGWWQSHTAGERDWLLLSLADPLTAEQRLASNRLTVLQALEASGVNQPPEAVVDFIAGRFTTGAWSEAQMRHQMLAISDPATGYEVDAELAAVISGASSPLDTTQQRREDVRNMVQKWLGPIHGAWSESQIDEWAGKLRTDPDAEETLTGFLRQQRKALLPDYDENLTYDTIAAPWRGFWTQTLGEVADETQPVFLDVLAKNNTAEAGKLLRQHGITTNNQKVRQDISQAFQRSFGTIRKPAF